MKIITVLVASFLVSYSACAGILSLNNSDEKLEGVPLAAQGTANVESAVPISRLGYGVRKKKVAFLKIDIYVAQLYGSDTKAYVREEEKALTSLAGMKAAAIQLDFLHDVPGEKLSSSFEESFQERGIEKSEALTKFLEAVRGSGEVAKGQTIKIAAERAADGKEVVAYEDPKGKVTKITGSPGFIRSIFSLWLGKMDDSGLEKLRDAFIKGSW